MNDPMGRPTINLICIKRGSCQKMNYDKRPLGWQETRVQPLAIAFNKGQKAARLTITPKTST